jgi:hypothetical protein
MNRISVGQSISRDTSIPVGCWFDCSKDDGCTLYVCFSHPTEKEIINVEHGQFECAFAEEGDIILMFFKYGTHNWMDAPYSCKLEVDVFGHYDLPVDPRPGEGVAFTTVLVDADNGVVKVLRLIGLGHEFTKEMFKAIREQLARPWVGRQEYERQVQHLFRRPTSELVNTAIARWKL